MLSLLKKNEYDRRLFLKFGLIAVLVIVVCIMVLITHWPALSAKAISIDDDIYFTKNPLVRNPSWGSAITFLSEAFEPSTVGGYYQPLTMISLMIDYELGGQTNSLRPFHRTSLILHTANTALIIILMYGLFGQIWIAAAIGLLFGVHPLTVETIPWVSERKTLLATFFALWSLILYVRFARRGNFAILFGCIFMYMLALMSKPTATPLPVMMLLMDYWPLKRLKWKTMLEKIPFFIVGSISAVITYISQNSTTWLIKPETYGPSRIPLVICHNIIFYLHKMLWPVNLYSHYSFPEPFDFSTPMVRIGIIGTCILIALLVISLRWTRAAITGWLIFFIMVFPSLQLFQFSDVIAADKFAYLPSIGILMIIAAFLMWLCSNGNVQRSKIKNSIIAIAILLVSGAESFASRQYLTYWKDTVTLFTRMVQLDSYSIFPLNHLGNGYFEKGEFDKAIDCYTKSLKIKSDTSIYNNLAVILTMRGELDEALKWYKKAIQFDPANSEAYYNVSNILLSQGAFDQAITGYEKALSINPRYVKAYINLAIALSQEGRIDKAIHRLDEASKIAPGNVDIHYNMAMMLGQQGRVDEAIEHLGEAVKIQPRNVSIHYNLAMALGQKGRIDEAIEHFFIAEKLDPNDVEVHYGLAGALINKGRIQEAIKEYRQVIKLMPQDIETRCILGDILARLGQIDDAAAEYQKVLKMDPANSHAQQGLENIQKK